MFLGKCSQKRENVLCKMSFENVLGKENEILVF